MKRELMQRPLRYATAQAYDPSLLDPGILWVERSAEQFSLDEPIDTSHVNDERTGTLSDDVRPADSSFRREAIEGICANPLRDEPHPLIVGAVRRFGLVGLIACALGTAMLRGWQSLTRRPH